MTINQLTYFIAIVEHENYLDAAEFLHLSQSSLSKSIQRLEDELEVTLFDRSKRSSFLTPEGQSFYEGALNIMEAYHSTLDTMRKVSGKGHDKIRMITLPILSQYGLNSRLREFIEENTDIVLTIDEMEDLPIRQELSEGTCDIAITRKEVLGSGKFPHYPLTTDRLVALLPINHPLSGRGSIGLSELKQDKFILMNRYISIYTLCVQACQNAGFTPEVLRTARIETILSAVRSGEGVSLLMEKSLDVFNHAQTAVIPLEETVTSTVILALPDRINKNPNISRLVKKLLNI